VVSEMYVKNITDLARELEESGSFGRSWDTQTVANIILKRHLAFLGCMMRKQGFENRCLAGKIQETRAR